MDYPSMRGRSRAVRVEDVARIAGVSPITVSRALSSPEKVREETRAKVHKAVAETGYVVNTFASNLRSGRSSIVSIFVSQEQDIPVVQSIMGCSDALAEGGFHVTLTNANSASAEEELLRTAMPLRPAAVVFTGAIHSQRVRASLIELGLPVMEMWDLVPDPIDMLVGFSELEGGRLMGQHFAELGLLDVAYVGGPADQSRRSVAGFREVVERAGGRVGTILPTANGTSLAEGRDGLREVLARQPDCQGVFFSSDMLAAGALLHRDEIAPGRRIAIAGFGDLPLAQELPVPLTTIKLCAYDMGYRAGHMILARLSSQQQGRTTAAYPMQLQARESTLRVKD